MPGDTALHVAARVGSINSIHALCEMKGDPHAKNKQGKTAFDVAVDEITKTTLAGKMQGLALLRHQCPDHESTPSMHAKQGSWMPVGF